eukprot:4466652-Prymnesium_polylepis.1
MPLARGPGYTADTVYLDTAAIQQECTVQIHQIQQQRCDAGRYSRYSTYSTYTAAKQQRFSRDTADTAQIQ